MAYMYAGTILLVNLSEGKISKEPTTSYSDAFVGGRGINTKILYDGVPPEVSPLDPASLLIFGVGPLCGTPIPASRTEVTAKSPENGFLGSSNFGGDFGPELKFAGYDHIIITGKADKPVYLWIENERVEIRDASNIWGKDTYETQAIIRSELDPEAKVACIGQAGENLVHFATVQHELGHAGGRTGMGAVMGSKDLKAIVVRGTKEITFANPEKYMSLVQELQQELRNNPVIQNEQKYGVSFMQDAAHAAQGQVPRPVFSSDVFLKYQPKRAGCFGCPTQCMDLYPVKAKGGGVISCSLYTNPFYTVRNNDVDVLLECSLLAQRYGVDSVSSMGIVAWLMELYENGIITAKDTDGIAMEWGSKEAILGMFEKIVYREGFGDVLADGMLPAADRIGRGAKDYANHMKGMPLYEGRTAEGIVGAKGMALAVAMSSRGDTMRARTESYEEGGLGARSDEAARQKAKQIAGTEKAALRAEYEGKPELVVYSEDGIIINDCLSACKYMSSFLNLPFSEKYQAALFSAGTGIETSEDMLFELAKKVRNLERAYCVREGMTRKTDSLPKRFMDHPIEEGPSKGEVLKSSEFEKMKNKYYELRGWDIATGIPTRETLEQAGLKDVARDLEKRGKLPGKSAEGAKQNKEALAPLPH